MAKMSKNRAIEIMFEMAYESIGEHDEEKLDILMEAKKVLKETSDEEIEKMKTGVAFGESINKEHSHLVTCNNELRSKINKLNIEREETMKKFNVCKKELLEHKLLLSMVEKIFLKYDVTINADKFPDGNRYMILLEEMKGGICITRERHYGKTIQEVIFNAGKEK